MEWKWKAWSHSSSLRKKKFKKAKYCYLPMMKVYSKVVHFTRVFSSKHVPTSFLISPPPIFSSLSFLQDDSASNSTSRVTSLGSFQMRYKWPKYLDVAYSDNGLKNNVKKEKHQCKKSYNFFIDLGFCFPRFKLNKHFIFPTLPPQKTLTVF